MPARVERHRTPREPTDNALAILKAARVKDDVLVKAQWPDLTGQMGTGVSYGMPPKDGKTYSAAALMGNRPQ
ncbi:MAG TPA: hypothetical protein VGQ52_13915 [Gemmatimonadaceae bacterium]|jgi:hypothetical protein|nr:hypothetical protein [Gemmatimonadaceae bacterium]